MSALRGKVSELERAAAQRKAKLDENSAFLQFNWKADVVESWIGTNTKLCLSFFKQSHSKRLLLTINPGGSRLAFHNINSFSPSQANTLPLKYIHSKEYLIKLKP